MPFRGEESKVPKVLPDFDINKVNPDLITVQKLEASMGRRLNYE